MFVQALSILAATDDAGVVTLLALGSFYLATLTPATAADTRLDAPGGATDAGTETTHASGHLQQHVSLKV